VEGCDPDAEVRLAQQPAWPFEYATDPTTPTVEVDLDETRWSTSPKALSSATSPTPCASSSAGKPASSSWEP
jgi:hypothetical protein